MKMPAQIRWIYVVLVVLAIITLVTGWLVHGSAVIPPAADIAQPSTEVGRWAVSLRVAEVVLLALGTLSVLLLVEQLRQTARWNKRLSYHQFFQEIPAPVKRIALEKLATEKQIDLLDRLEPLPDATVGMLLAGDPRQVVMQYLNDFEEFAYAVRTGLVDHDYAFALEQCRVKRAWLVFEPWIRRLRTTTMYAGGYQELELLAQSWVERSSKNHHVNVSQT